MQVYSSIYNSRAILFNLNDVTKRQGDVKKN